MLSIMPLIRVTGTKNSTYLFIEGLGDSQLGKIIRFFKPDRFSKPVTI
jgi:hypothetical protein